jgi:hypothetical protein
MTVTLGFPELYMGLSVVFTVTLGTELKVEEFKDGIVALSSEDGVLLRLEDGGEGELNERSRCGDLTSLDRKFGAMAEK